MLKSSNNKKDEISIRLTDSDVTTFCTNVHTMYYVQCNFIKCYIYNLYITSLCASHQTSLQWIYVIINLSSKLTSKIATTWDILSMHAMEFLRSRMSGNLQCRQTTVTMIQAPLQRRWHPNATLSMFVSLLADAVCLFYLQVVQTGVTKTCIWNSVFVTRRLLLGAGQQLCGIALQPSTYPAQYRTRNCNTHPPIQELWLHSALPPG